MTIVLHGLKRYSAMLRSDSHSESPEGRSSRGQSPSGPALTPSAVVALLSLCEVMHPVALTLLQQSCMHFCRRVDLVTTVICHVGSTAGRHLLLCVSILALSKQQRFISSLVQLH